MAKSNVTFRKKEFVDCSNNRNRKSRSLNWVGRCSRWIFLFSPKVSNDRIHMRGPKCMCNHGHVCTYAPQHQSVPALQCGGTRMLALFTLNLSEARAWQNAKCRTQNAKRRGRRRLAPTRGIEGKKAALGRLKGTAVCGPPSESNLLETSTRPSVISQIVRSVIFCFRSTDQGTRSPPGPAIFLLVFSRSFLLPWPARGSARRVPRDASPLG